MNWFYKFSWNKFLDRYFFNLHKCLEFFGTVTSETILKKASFVNMNLVFSFDACNNNLVDSFPYKYMSC